MCLQCFNTEFSRFDSEDEFESFYSILKSKPALKRIGFVERDMGPPTFKIFWIEFHGEPVEMGHTILECSHCGQKWKLAEPENSWRGYFVRQ